jgi:hypothetical protein
MTIHSDMSPLTEDERQAMVTLMTTLVTEETALMRCTLFDREVAVVAAYREEGDLVMISPVAIVLNDDIRDQLVPFAPPEDSFYEMPDGGRVSVKDILPIDE